MTANVGTIDRIARVIIGIALIAFALGYIAPGTSWLGRLDRGRADPLLLYSAPARFAHVLGCSTK